MLKGLSRQRQRRLAWRLTAAVALLHGALLLTLAVGEDRPWRLAPFELLWAWANQPMFYPLVAVGVLGPVLTALAWWVPGRHRYYLLGIWAAGILVNAALFAGRVGLMLDILHWRFIE